MVTAVILLIHLEKRQSKANYKDFSFCFSEDYRPRLNIWLPTDDDNDVSLNSAAVILPAFVPKRKIHVFFIFDQLESPPSPVSPSVRFSLCCVRGSRTLSTLTPTSSSSTSPPSPRETHARGNANCPRRKGCPPRTQTSPRLEVCLSVEKLHSLRKSSRSNYSWGRHFVGSTIIYLIMMTFGGPEFKKKNEFRC